MPRSGPRNPVAGTSVRAPGSVRRTVTTDVTFPDGIGARVVADVRGRDLRTEADGTTDVLDELAVAFTVDPWTQAILAVDVAAGPAQLEALVGVELQGTFVRSVAERLSEDAALRTLCYSALEDLRGAQLVSGYAALRAGLIPDAPEVARIAVDRQGDICVGWALDGPVIETLRSTGHNPVPIGPVAPDVDGGDRLGWHAVAPLAPHPVRRRRRTDVAPADDSGGLRVEHHFRDSHCGAGIKRVMHEYLVDARFGGDRRLAAIDVDARVLPWYECPGAVASARQLVGVALGELPAQVRSELRGVTTCTHLNSTLRALADAGALVRSL